MFRGYTLRNRITIFFLMIISTLLVGAIGYVHIKTNIEGGSPTAIDALYWTVVTISTLGYSNNGINLTSQAGELFSIFMIGMGVFIIFVGIEIGIGPWFEMKMKRIVEKRSPPVPEKGHVIVAGLSEIGEESLEELRRRAVPVVVVDNDERKIRELIAKEIPAISGDPSRESVLLRANIKEARALLATSDDTANAFISLTARHINPKIRIAASVSEKSSEKILRNSGAGIIAMPKKISGEILASKAMGEEAGARGIDDIASLYQIPVKKGSRLEGKSPTEIAGGGILPVGVRRKGEFMPLNTGIRLKAGDVLNLIATKDSIKAVKEGYL